VAQLIIRLALAGVITCLGCDRAPAAPDVGSQPSGVPTVYTTPPIRGLVRETNGGPIAGTAISMFAAAGSGRTPWIETDGAGIFVLPPSSELCQSARSVSLDVRKMGFVFPFMGPISCTAVSDSAEVALEVKGQRHLIAASGYPVEITLSNDDLDWRDEQYGGYSCGRCRKVELKVPTFNFVVVRAEWSGFDPIHLWVEGDRDGYGDLVRLGEARPSPGERDVALSIPEAWRDLYLTLKVGLPYGSRFPAASPPVLVRIEVRS